MPRMVLSVPGVLLLLSAVLRPGQAHFYSEDDPLVSLETGARALLMNSPNCWLAQFYASWCGHCMKFKPNWLSLAEDVKDWRPVVYLAVLDCGLESNSKTCTDFGVSGFPTMKFFNTYSQHPSDGIRFYHRDPKQIREFIIDRLEAQIDSPPPACPPLGPISAPEIDHFFENNDDESYLAVIFENVESYTAREVALDMVQYHGVSVRRVLSEQSELVEHYKVSSFPSGFILCRNGSISKINLKEESRAEYTKFLRSLPGVRKLTVNLIEWSANPVDDTVIRKPVNRSAIYMVDLESSISYSLRVEVARYTSFNGDRLRALINYVSVLKKYFPARPYLKNLLDFLHPWLYKQRTKMVLYKDIEDVLNNVKNHTQNAVLTPHANFVWCQGSKQEFRGYPCSVWTLYHLLTVRAAELGSRQTNPQEVLKTMRGYIYYFFGCRDCAEHFEEMAKESMNSVRSPDDAIKWLWSKHNTVNKRLAGDETEDPDFPKVQWPPVDVCPDCQIKDGNNVTWDEAAVIRFMKKRFVVENLSHDYVVSEDVLLQNQKKRTDRVRSKREVEEEEEEEEEKDLEKQTVSPSVIPPVKAEEPEDKPIVSKEKPNPHRKPTIIKMKTAYQAGREMEEEIVDLDKSAHHFQQRTLQDSNSKKNRFAIQPERMMDLPDYDFDQEAVRVRLLKRGVDANAFLGVVVENGEVNWKGRWVKMLEVGFSRLDISICVILYFLTSMCLLGMYLYLSFRSRLRQRCLFLQP
ncbi:sulfhydryl oxidase 1 [Leptodactylus fuscus]|uniref:sulfhydryl oxidase 1 n=1 Tax=Leptodactylus fuscus TaxID=238119 RepID=UPI003F4F0430